MKIPVLVIFFQDLVSVGKRERTSEVVKDRNSKAGFLPTTQPLLNTSTIN